MTIVMRGGQMGGGGDSPQDNIPLQPPRSNPVPSPNVVSFFKSYVIVVLSSVIFLYYFLFT